MVDISIASLSVRLLLTTQSSSTPNQEVISAHSLNTRVMKEACVDSVGVINAPGSLVTPGAPRVRWCSTLPFQVSTAKLVTRLMVSDTLGSSCYQCNFSLHYMISICPLLTSHFRISGSISQLSFYLDRPLQNLSKKKRPDPGNISDLVDRLANNNYLE